MIPYFTVTDEVQFSLPIALYLVGYVLGPLFFAPLSETYGRKLIMISSFILFALFTLACSLAPTWPFFLVFRLLAGISASSAISIVGGLLADIYNDPVTRGRALALLMAVGILLARIRISTLIIIGYKLWPTVKPNSLRICLCCQLEMAILDKPHLCWRCTGFTTIHTRDI